METEIKCVAVDDEAPALRILEQYISGHKNLVLAAQFRNPVKAAEWLGANDTHILFLDIQMPQLSGMDMLKALKKKPIVIFTTAFSEFGADAFDLDAADYLRKPFSFERFSKSIEKAMDYLNANVHTASLLIQNEQQENFLSIKVNGGLVKIYFHEILYVEGFQEYVKIFTEKERFITYERMKNMESILPKSHFMRVHKSFIVALKHVRMVTGNLLEINDNQIPVSRHMKDELISRIF